MTAVSMLPVSAVDASATSVLTAGLLLPPELRPACQLAPASPALTAGSMLPAGTRPAGQQCLLLPCSGGRRTLRRSLPAALGPSTSGKLPCMLGGRRPGCALRVVALPPCKCGTSCTPAPGVAHCRGTFCYAQLIDWAPSAPPQDGTSAQTRDNRPVLAPTSPCMAACVACQLSIHSCARMPTAQLQGGRPSPSAAEVCCYLVSKAPAVSCSTP